MNIRKTLTNIKRIDRLKMTARFLLFQVVTISLFCIFGISGTAHATEDNTTVITARVENYSRHIGYGKGHSKIYFKAQIDGEQYKLGSYKTVTADDFEELLKASPSVTLRLDKNVKVAQMHSDGVEYLSLDKYNADMTNWRIVWIVLFSLAEAFFVAVYVLYMIYHRTSKDKRIL